MTDLRQEMVIEEVRMILNVEIRFACANFITALNNTHCSINSPRHLIVFPSSFSNRQPRPASSTSPGGHWCVWGAFSPTSSTTCGLRGRGACSRSLQRSLCWRRPPLGPQGLFRERSASNQQHNRVAFSYSLFSCVSHIDHLWCHFSQLWPSMTIPRTRRTSCLSWKEPSST